MVRHADGPGAQIRRQPTSDADAQQSLRASGGRFKITFEASLVAAPHQHNRVGPANDLRFGLQAAHGDQRGVQCSPPAAKITNPLIANPDAMTGGYMPNTTRR